MRHLPIALVLCALAGCGHQSTAQPTSQDSRLRAMQQAAAAAAPSGGAGDASVATRATAGKPLARPQPVPLAITRVAIARPASGNALILGTVELAVGLTTASTKPYNPEPAQGGIDLSASFSHGATTMSCSGFWDGSSWRIRFTPTVAGAWSCVVTATDASRTATASPLSFTVDPRDPAAPAPRGFLRIANGYLASDQAPPFLGIGHNTGWQYDPCIPSLATMAASGENLLSFWMAVPWARPTEDPAAGTSGDRWRHRRSGIENADTGLGTYDQDVCRSIDQVVADAEANGIALLPSLWSHGQLRSTSGHPWGPGWYESYNPYARIASATAFFTTGTDASPTSQWRSQRNLLRYIQARWGSSPAIAGWVTVVEYEGTTAWLTSSGRSAATAWAGKVSEWFRAHDPYRTDAAGFPVASSRSDGDAAPAWDAPGGLRAADSYAAQGSDDQVAGVIANQTSIMRASGKPSFHTEFGGDLTKGASQPRHLHNGVWAALATGACMTPLVWTDGGSFPLLTTDMAEHLRVVSQVQARCQELAAGPTSTADLSASTGRAWGRRIAGASVFAWVQRPATGGAWSPVSGATITVRGLAAAHGYWPTWYPTWPGSPAPTPSEVFTDAAGVVTLTVPVVADPDIAVRLDPAAGG